MNLSGKDGYLIWCKSAGVYSDFVRPTPFVFNNNYLSESINYPLNRLVNEDLVLKLSSEVNCALIIDLPSYQSIFLSLELIDYGFAPIPLFNGCNSSALSLVDNFEIERALIEGALKLQNTSFEVKAPAFLLDTNRLHRHKPNKGVFDNSYDIFVQDFPSKKALLNRGIDKIAVVNYKNIVKFSLLNKPNLIDKIKLLRISKDLKRAFKTFFLD